MILSPVTLPFGLPRLKPIRGLTLKGSHQLHEAEKN